MACGWLVHWSKMFQPQTFFHCRTYTQFVLYIFATEPKILCLPCHMFYVLCVLKHSFPIPRDVYTTMLFGLPRVPLSWQIHEISHCHGNCPMISIQKSWHAVDQPYKQTAFNQAAWNCLCILQCSTVLIGARGDKVTSANLHWVCPHSSQCEGWFKVWVSIRVCWRSPSLLQCVATHSQLWGLD